MTKNAPQPKANWLQNLLLIVGGVLFALLMLMGLLALFPNLIPTSQTRREAGTTLNVTFRLTDGDLWVHQRGRIRPPAEDTILGQWTIRWDENGFRVPKLQAESYPIVALGDSYTEGTTVERPWPDGVAELLGVPVQNYGYRGYGALEIQATAEQFLGATPRTWVLYAHFSGNDLWNANEGLSALARSPLGQLDWLARQAGDNLALRNTEIVENATYDYPMPVIIGGSYFEQVFIEDLLWWQVGPPEGFLGSRTFDVIGEALDRIGGQVGDATCRAVIFIPSKEQIYYPYIHPQSQTYFNVAFRSMALNGQNQVVLRPATLAEADIPAYIARLGEQRDAMRQLAEEHGWLFIDLLPVFQAEALQERMLYYEYDSHWNQEGADLAAQSIADFMRDQPNCPLS